MVIPVADVKNPVANRSVGDSRRSIAGSATLWRVRTTRHGSGGLIRYTTAAVPSTPMSSTTGGGIMSALRQVMRRQHNFTDMIRVAAREAMPPIVKRVAKLASARNRLENRTVGLETEVPACAQTPPAFEAAIDFESYRR